MPFWLPLRKIDELVSRVDLSIFAAAFALVVGCDLAYLRVYPFQTVLLDGGLPDAWCL